MLGREPVLGRLTLLLEPEEPKLGRRTLVVRAGVALERLLDGRLIEYREFPIDAGRRTLLARDGFTRGWLTIELLGLERGAALVSVGPLPVRPTARVLDTVEVGGRWTTVVREGFTPRRLTESTRVLLGRVRDTVPVRPLGERVTVPTRLG
ncbi:MAG: hypothetical protein ACN4G0_11035 [Polyangiales bacterium]